MVLPGYLTPRKTLIALIVLWAFAAGVAVFYLNGRTQESLQRYLNEQTLTQQVAWEASLRTHKSGAETYFQEYVLNPITLSILHNAQNPATRDEARKRLLAHLGGPYERMQENGIRQLHFYLPNGDSFLRFHFPHRYGDNLFEARYGIRVSMQEKRAVSGFEVGKVVSGFRNVFPIITEAGEHLGGVELSMPFEWIRREVAALRPDREFQLIINAAQLETRLFDQQKPLYQPWPGSAAFMIEDPDATLEDSAKPASPAVLALSSLLAANPQAQALLAKGASGSVALEWAGKPYTITLTAARDVEGRVAGFLVSYCHTPALNTIAQNRTDSLLSTLGILSLLALALWGLVANRNALSIEKQRLQTIYDTIGEGLYVMNAQGVITHANQSAQTLLGYTAKEMIGSVAHTLFHAHSRNGNMPLEACPIYKTIREARPYDGVEEFRRKDGSQLTARVFSRPLYDRGAVSGSVTTFEDVTEELKSRRMLQTIYDVLPVGITVTDPKGNIIDCNTASEQILGLSKADHLARNYAGKEWRIIRPDGSAMPSEEFASVRALKERRPVRDVEMGIVKPGGTAWISVSALPVEHADYGMVVAYVDITARKAIESALAEQRSRLESILWGTGVSTWEWNVQSGETRFNEQWANMIGYRLEELEPVSIETWMKFTHPDDLARSGQALERHFRGESDHYECEARMRHKSGHWIWILDRGRVIERDAEGKPLKMAGTHFDINARKEAELRLQQLSEKLADQVEHEVAERLKSEAKYKHLFNAVPDAIMVHGFEPNGMPSNFSEVNDAACAMTGLTREAFTQISPAQINTHRPVEETARLAEILRSTGRLEFEEEVIHPGGKPRTVLTMARIVNLSGRPTVITVLRDITELKKLEQERELQQAVLIQQSKQAELGSMIGAIAHQWKQPLNAIAIMTQNLIDSYDYNELDRRELEDHIEKVMHQVQFMSQTITDFRNFYKPGREREPFSPVAAVRSVADLLKTQLNQHHIILQIEGDESLRCTGYPSEFKQVALNLINNARDAFDEKGVKNGRIHVRANAIGDWLRIEFEDNGGGIAPGLLPDKLFEPFNSTKGDKGTGIGLPLAKTIVEEKMQGRLSAANTAQGAVFTIELPRHKEQK